jgi:hypothetical protein
MMKQLSLQKESLGRITENMPFSRNTMAFSFRVNLFTQIEVINSYLLGTLSGMVLQALPVFSWLFVYWLLLTQTVLSSIPLTHNGKHVRVNHLL